MIDKHVTEKDVLELLAKNESQNAPKKLSADRIRINEIKEELKMLVKEKEGRKVKKKKVDNIPSVAEIKKSILKKGRLKN